MPVMLLEREEIGFFGRALANDLNDRALWLLLCLSSESTASIECRNVSAFRHYEFTSGGHPQMG